MRSWLDFWLPDGAVELVTYAHSIDFGAKGYGTHQREAAHVPLGVRDPEGIIRLGH